MQVLHSLQKCIQLIVQAVLQEYLGIAGNPEFCKLSAKLAFGADSKALQEGRAATVQSLSGTGSLRVCIKKRLFASSWYPCVNSIHISHDARPHGLV